MAEIILLSIDNIRDFGGIKIVEGKKIRENRLIRSAKLIKASADDLHRIFLSIRF
ncbi:MAG: tyrosine-protein phosphatase [Erysipelotrichaceae bacterium]|nr:tyrosine-protein phosphatase [Erysipelotrichaceae bacterium]